MAHVGRACHWKCNVILFTYCKDIIDWLHAPFTLTIYSVDTRFSCLFPVDNTSVFLSRISAMLVLLLLLIKH